MRRAGRTLLLAAILLSAVAWRPGIPSRYYGGVLMDTHSRWPSGGCDGCFPFTGALQYGRNDSCLAAVVDTLNELGAMFCILNGDWAEDLMYANANANADSFAAITARAQFEWWPVMGNHEALAKDTTGNPYSTAAERFPSKFGLHNWWTKDYRNIRFFATQNNCNYDVHDAADYRVNNPFSGGVVPGYDYDGITVPASAQRVALHAAADSTARGGKWLVVAGHRPVYGTRSAVDSRWPLLSQGRGTGFIRAIEQRITSWERFPYFGADEHLPVWHTVAVRDSGLAAPGTSGGYHLMCVSGGGVRQADTTDCFAAGTTWLSAYLATDKDDGTRFLGRTSTAVADTMSEEANPNRRFEFTWMLLTIEADRMRIQTFLCQSHRSSGWSEYTGAGAHLLLDDMWIRRDNR